MLRKMEESLDCFNQKEQKQLEAIIKYVYNLFSKDSTGHDFFHLKRVVRLSRKIATYEQANLFVSEAGAWLHEIGDVKLFKNPQLAKEQMINFLQSISINEKTIQDLLIAIEDISFRKGKTPKSLEGKVIQDADRLDALGAIGIARTFAYGGATGQLIYHEGQPENTTIQHFYDKLLLLKDQMNTTYGQQIAVKRHFFMELFLEQFFKEW